MNDGAAGDSYCGFSFNERVREPRERRGVFRDFKTPLNNLYGNINALQSYQMFTMSSNDLGVVHCRETLESQGDVQNVLAAATSRTNITAGEVYDSGRQRWCRWSSRRGTRRRSRTYTRRCCRLCQRSIAMTLCRASRLLKISAPPAPKREAAPSPSSRASKTNVVRSFSQLGTCRVTKKASSSL